MLHGTCLCGDIQYTIDHELTSMSHCHCSMCRKAHGSLFATYAGAPRAAVVWTSGESQIARHQSSSGFERAFCPTCGSVIYGAPVGDETLYFPVGNLDDSHGVHPQCHIFVASKALWYDITDDLPQHDAYAASNLIVARADRSSESPGMVGGSCLRAMVRFRYAGLPERMWNCHCQRCRRARGAAHATNVFVDKANFEWLAGEENVAVYRLPGTKRFGQAFCRDCGGAVARVNPDVAAVAIPAGSLDDDPGARPAGHIYVGSKSSWYPITDAVVQYEEAVT